MGRKDIDVDINIEEDEAIYLLPPYDRKVFSTQFLTSILKAT